jgi:2-amino-4-hydroxy-6-hydroxymethyldihydropteridine diphosphokinase
MTPDGVDAYIGLGSNLDGPVDHLLRAFDELHRLPQTRLVRRSPLYRSPPLGPAGQADYVNAVAGLQTMLAPDALLDGLQAIERAHGRERGERWGPRTLDLDLLVYGEQQIDNKHLVVPHPQMHRRAFVLVPLHDIAPELLLPGLGPLAQWVRRIDGRQLTPIAAGVDA